MAQDLETYLDRPLHFFIPARHTRGRLVRLDAVLNDILSAHAYPPPVEAVLAEALVLTALLGSLISDTGGQLTLQAQTEAGPVRLLVCDYKDGALRGYAQFDPDAVADLPNKPTLFAIFGKGYLAITFDRQKSTADESGRYQGIVPLEGASLADAVEHYFAQSEQLPSLVRCAVTHDADGAHAAGMLLQHMPEGEEGRERLHIRADHPEWEHILALATTITGDELLHADLSLEDIVWRLFHEEEQIRVDPAQVMTKGCRCDLDHIRAVLAQFPADDREEMADSDGLIGVDCAFCSKKFPVSIHSLDN